MLPALLQSPLQLMQLQQRIRAQEKELKSLAAAAATTGLERPRSAAGPASSAVVIRQESSSMAVRTAHLKLEGAEARAAAAEEQAAAAEAQLEVVGAALESAQEELEAAREGLREEQGRRAEAEAAVAAVAAHEAAKWRGKLLQIEQVQRVCLLCGHACKGGVRWAAQGPTCNHLRCALPGAGHQPPTPTPAAATAAPPHRPCSPQSRVWEHWQLSATAWQLHTSAWRPICSWHAAARPGHPRHTAMSRLSSASRRCRCHGRTFYCFALHAHWLHVASLAAAGWELPPRMAAWLACMQHPWADGRQMGGGASLHDRHTQAHPYSDIHAGVGGGAGDTLAGASAGGACAGGRTGSDGAAALGGCAAGVMGGGWLCIGLWDGRAVTFWCKSGCIGCTAWAPGSWFPRVRWHCGLLAKRAVSHLPHSFLPAFLPLPHSFLFLQSKDAQLHGFRAEIDALITAARALQVGRQQGTA